MLAAISLFFFAAGPSGQVAYVHIRESGAACAEVIDIATGQSHTVGPCAQDGPPVWSHDGQWLAFESATDAGQGIYVARADGSRGRLLSCGQNWNAWPAWSHDGARIAYTAGQGSNQHIRVYTLLSDTERIWGGERRGLLLPSWLADAAIVVALASQEGFEAVPSSSLFGQESLEEGALLAVGIVAGSRGISTDIFILTATESIPFPQWGLPSKGDYAEWKPQASVKNRGLVFESNDGGDREIFVLTRKGSYDLSNHRDADWNPVWSPDGRWIAFESFRGRRRGIYRVHRDTIRVFPVAAGDADGANWWPDWSPDGNWIVHVSDRSGAPAIYVTNIDGDETIRVTRGAGQAVAPAWRPTAKR